MNVADFHCVQKPSVDAGVLLHARNVAPQICEGWTVARITETTGASRSQAYAMAARIAELCVTLQRPAGRPSGEQRHGDEFRTACAVRDYLADHPGAVAGRAQRRVYSDRFRRFIISLCEPDAPAHTLTIEQLGEATGIPLGTLKDWRRLPQPHEIPSDSQTPETTSQRPVELREIAGDPKVAALLDAWINWKGNFTTFCDHVWKHLRLPWRRTFISRLLQAAGLRQPDRRRQPRPSWNIGTFRRLFPGAQWLGDGTTLAIRFRGTWYAFNLEAVSDLDSNAVVGIHVGDAENEDAVLQAFLNGEKTTGEKPVFMTLDAKPCNHTENLEKQVQPTVIVPATPKRGQAKAPLEGTFGLFSQTAPPLCVDGEDDRELARSSLALTLLTWCWARNGKPRPRLQGRSPADYYDQANPTDEQRNAARAWGHELKRRYQRFLQTRQRRAEPARRQILIDALQRWGIQDAAHRLATDLARYAIEAILRAIAAFQAKLDMGALHGIEQLASYFAAMVRNQNQAIEIEATAHQLLELRLRHRDLCLAPLQELVEKITRSLTPNQLPGRLVELALEAERLIDFRFYAAQAGRALEALDPEAAQTLFPFLARKVAWSFRTDKQRRDDLVAILSAAVAYRPQ